MPQTRHALPCIANAAAPDIARRSGNARAVTIRHRLYVTTGQVVRYARQWTMKLSRHRRATVEEAIGTIRLSALA